MKAYIISYNRLTPLRRLCRELVKRGCTPVIIDNSSTYPYLLRWLDHCKYEVITIPNTGSRSPWIHGIAKEDYYIISDHDLEISDVPLDMVLKMQKNLANNVACVKVGLSLRLDDLPENEYTAKVKEHEKPFWVTQLADGNYSAPIDTTLALYSRERLEKICKNNIRHPQFYNAVRLAPPYSAKHLPWYNLPDKLTDEEKYYFDHLTSPEGHWNHEFKRTFYEKD